MVHFCLSLYCDVIVCVAKITETQFARLCDQIVADREDIVRANPIGTAEETLLWMLLGVLVSYLSLSDKETPCFTGIPDAETYRKAILHVLRGRMKPAFEAEPYLKKIV